MCPLSGNGQTVESNLHPKAIEMAVICGPLAKESHSSIIFHTKKAKKKKRDKEEKQLLVRDYMDNDKQVKK